MALKIQWTQRASESLEQVIDYLKKEWGEKATYEFIQKTFYIIELLSNYPQIGSIENSEKNIRGILLTKHNRLFYRFDNERIMLLGIIDTRKRKISI